MFTIYYGRIFPKIMQNVIGEGPFHFMFQHLDHDYRVFHKILYTMLHFENVSGPPWTIGTSTIQNILIVYYV